MSFVVDASVAVKWVVEEVGSLEAAALHGEDLHAPDWLQVECANVLWAKARRRELTRREATERLAWLLGAPVHLTSACDLLDRASFLAHEIAHPVYDCLYLALAIELSSPLITADDRFVAAVRRSDLHDVRIHSLREPPGADLIMEGS